MKLGKRRGARNIIIIGPLLILTLITTNVSSGECVPPEVVKAAADGLNSFLGVIPLDDLSHYGFSNKEELSKASLGEAIRVHTITPDKIIDYDPGKEFLTLVSQTKVWFFSVQSDGDIKTLLTVDMVDGKYKAVAIGSSGLAKQLNKIKKEWPESKGYNHTLVRIYQAKSDFIIVAKERTVKIAPLESASLMLGVEKAKMNLHEPSEIMFKLISPVQKNLELDNAF